MKKRYILVFFLLILFLIIAILVGTNSITSLDDAIYNTIFKVRNNFWDAFFKFITKFGNTMTILYIVILLFLILKKENQYLLGGSVILTVLSNQVIKFLMKRPRPDHLRLIKQGGYSFPSGHSMISVAVYGFLIYFINKKVKNKYLKILLIILLSSLILGVGVSRIYVGVHYPSDVLAGYALALSILIMIIDLDSKFIRGNKNDKDGCK